MAVVHVAFQFNPSDYYKELLNRMFTDGSWNPDNARILARSIVSEATSEEEETLLYFRFDHSWLPYEAIEGSTPTDWAVLFLTKMLTKSPSLSNRFMGSYAILKTLLPLAGWSPEEINMLLTGRNLGRGAMGSELRNERGIVVMNKKPKSTEVIGKFLRKRKGFTDEATEALA